MDRIRQFEGDIPYDFKDMIRKHGFVSWDIETSGLDWRTDRIACVNLWVPGEGVGAIVRLHKAHRRPGWLRALLNDNTVLKTFHHAMFDCRFMAHQWNVYSQRLACTKIAAKILQVPHAEQSLKNLLATYLDEYIPKGQAQSDWFADELSEQQVTYAVQDVKYLHLLVAKLQAEASKQRLLRHVEDSWAYLPTRVWLETHDYEADTIFTY